jgi:hypothetical protein
MVEEKAGKIKEWVSNKLQQVLLLPLSLYILLLFIKSSKKTLKVLFVR